LPIAEFFDTGNQRQLIKTALVEGAVIGWKLLLGKDK
jgi:hypothetical protein